MDRKLQLETLLAGLSHEKLMQGVNQDNQDKAAEHFKRSEIHRQEIKNLFNELEKKQ